MNSTRILSQRVDCITLTQAYYLIRERVRKNHRAYLFAMNLHILIELSKNLQFKRKHAKANVIFADGVSMVWLSKLTKNSLPARVSGTDLVEKLLEDRKLKIFLLGSTSEVLRKVKSKYPRTVVGYYSPPFRKLWGRQENEKIVTLINKSKTQIVLVGVGPLKQEKWIVNNLKKTKALVGIGCGSAFDIISGKTPRAPNFMKDYGFEWLWRILLEPKRLTGRYIDDFLYILKLAKRELTIKLTERFST
ncbi:MAG: WecB/TagA/CpsF family glycosyltransferase [Patescibacteria group bacterium]